MDHAKMLKCSSYVHLPSIKNVSISLRFVILSHSVQCRRGNYFRAWLLYFSFGTCYDANIKQLCSSSMYKPNLKIWPRYIKF